jgi:DHA1 family bicyclomycin/chloramphenicol resistance-like MFS transporter
VKICGLLAFRYFSRMQSRQPSRVLIIFLLGAFDTIAPLTIDMYLPAFSQMAAEFNTTTARISLSLTSYFVGLGIGQIFYGPLLDRFGRHKPLYAGMSLYIIACFGCALSTSVEMLIAFRFLQAMGGSVSLVGVRAMVRDHFTVEESPKIFSMMMLILSVSPLLAPSLGGLIVEWLRWEWIFVILAVIVVIILLVTYLFLPETYVPDASISLKPGPMIRNFISICRNTQFLTYTSAASFSLGGLFIYLAGSTVILLDEFKVSPAFYAILFALQSVGLIVGNQLNIMLLKRYKSRQLFHFALTLQMLSAAVFLAGAWFGWYGVYTTIMFFFILLTCLGMTLPNGSAEGLAPFKKHLGSASALMGFLQTSIGGLVSALVGIFNAQGTLPVAAMMFVSSFAAWVVLQIGRRVMAHQALQLV